MDTRGININALKIKYLSCINDKKKMSCTKNHKKIFFGVKRLVRFLFVLITDN
ncbi:hypothetical protein THIOM_002936 [Candidatus Thiomargarita nelsonii]|uniref:Uncharacterized protein n=1 Tax=Candidatus Thiomargarita nelsonii TaxID=1003181 RepID=A0A176RZW5_9GAMM|nr:hypothetical protein THIOM_002936 [Candidatus Thiomargarita nelsonii]